jgi:ribosomal protein S18 acetylase RimI-like enzyme
MQFRNLDNYSTASLLDAFNEAFADYFVKLRLTKDQLEKKIIADSIDLKLSVGAFEAEKLAGFILHGIDTINGQPVIYNAGTGVLPEYRGNRLTKAMYAFVMQELKAQNVSKCVLEVIEQNKAAIKTYSDIGFTFKRELVCFKGKVQAQSAQDNFTIKALDPLDWDRMESFWDWNSSWQNSITALKKNGENSRTIGSYHNDMLTGYLSWNPSINRVAQFAVAKTHRRQGIATALFHSIPGIDLTEISIINVDKSSGATLAFLRSIGLNAFITQHEMELQLT